MQRHYTSPTTLQPQLATTTPLCYNYNYTYHYNCHCTAPRYIQQSWWGARCNHCNRPRKHNSNHLSVHQWIRSAIRESQQPTNPSYSLPIFETSAAALCGTTGMMSSYFAPWILVLLSGWKLFFLRVRALTTVTYGRNKNVEVRSDSKKVSDTTWLSFFRTLAKLLQRLEY